MEVTVAEKPVRLEVTVARELRIILERIICAEGSSMVLQDDGPFTVSIIKTDSRVSALFSHKENGEALAVELFGFSGVTEGEVGMIPSIVKHFRAA